ncbi:Hypothetical_protein [Hexamita inflata]|uniref:Hypothetical_protein n=1 Tax=Hexamita inflata TaxID=28002 RepID=A0AA86NE64_9EUKA|nr:Hypothetical protein HINF_LOCUS5153 [Hexamita inflata]CAI9917515.1 Hypothetical protein HINF_LOCUS5160 [Hexamita inflata]
MHLYKDGLLTVLGSVLLWSEQLFGTQILLQVSPLSTVEQRFLACTLMVIIVHNIALRTSTYHLQKRNSGVQLYEARKWPLYSKASAHGTTLSNTFYIPTECLQWIQKISHFQKIRNNIKNKQGDRRPRENQMLAGKLLAQDQTNLNQRQREGKLDSRQFSSILQL